MDWMQKKPRRPKLERRNALKNIDYEPTTSSSSSSSSPSSGSSALRGSRSLDIQYSDDRTSFRIDGTDGEMDRICRSLGLSGPDDFGIPMAAWESRKLRSSSDLLPRSRLHQIDSPKLELPTMENGRAYEDISELSDRIADCVRVSGCSRGGIKGVRPPILAPPPPPSILKPLVYDARCSTWDLLRSFAPDAAASTYVNQRDCSSSSEDDDDEEADGECVRSAVLSASCSFTMTSNEDDSSSTTTEPSSNISPNGRFKRNITYWEKGELLGRGSFGSVYEGIADGGFFIAVKEVSLLDQGDLARQSVYQLEQEIALLSQFEHENIVQYYGTDKDESKLYIFLELITKGSLLSLYQKYHLRGSQVSAYTRQILHGLKYLHDRNVVHRDIKCANILVDANGSVKLADFGLAKATKFNDVKSCKGTAFWMAPEVVNQKNEGYGLAADIWSLGCTALEMLTRQLPYFPLECMPALFRIGRAIPPPVPDSLSRDARDFILQCLQVNPNDRPTAAQLLDHPFVKRPLPFSPSLAASHNPCRRV